MKLLINNLQRVLIPCKNTVGAGANMVPVLVIVVEEKNIDPSTTVPVTVTTGKVVRILVKLMSPRRLAAHLLGWEGLQFLGQF